ncbi:MAG TPA: hypothetical protein VFU13_04085 [Steroidobacteraceae bacterium]|nr:hypothetical protein [Steroidobacteraceae bacterium]
MALFDFLARLLGKGPQPPHTRLSRDEAIAIARRAAADDPQSAQLTIAEVRLQSGNAIWSVSAAEVGRHLVISIDDATGAVLEKKHVGLR